jgi:poly(A) polymerase
MTHFKVWNPKVNPSDRAHIMPVITPAFPAMNSTHNVTETTKRILLDEFRRGYEVVRNVEMQRAKWNEVHEPHPFFQHYKDFLMIDILALGDEVFKKYCGWVESKLRILMMQLEQVRGMIIHPNPVQFDMHGADEEWPFGCSMFIAISFAKEQGAFPGMSVDLRPAIAPFFDIISNWSDKPAYLNQFHLRLKRIGAAELPEYAQDPEGSKKGKRLAGSENGSSKRRRVV